MFQNNNFLTPYPPTTSGLVLSVRQRHETMFLVILCTYSVQRQLCPDFVPKAKKVEDFIAISVLAI